jgi:hypothetical protein
MSCSIAKRKGDTIAIMIFKRWENFASKVVFFLLSVNGRSILFYLCFLTTIYYEDILAGMEKLINITPIGVPEQPIVVVVIVMVVLVVVVVVLGM